MKSHIRTVVVLALAVGLVTLFLYNVDVRRVGSEIARSRPEWLALSLGTMFLNLALRAYRWQYLLEPLGRPSFGNAFRATAVGFAANSFFPRAGEVIRPYFLARSERHHEGMTATGAFATIILERLLDVVAVLTLLASFVLVFGRGMAQTNPKWFVILQFSAIAAGGASLLALGTLFVMAGDPVRLSRGIARFEQMLPSAFARKVGGVIEKFARGLAAIRRPGRLLVALIWSFPLWLSIAVGIWAIAVAFRLSIPFTGSFLILGILTLGVAIPTPGSIGGFHEAFRFAATTFYGAPDAAAVGAAIVLHAFSFGPALLLGLFYAAQAGLNISGMRRLADEAGHTPAA